MTAPYGEPEDSGVAAREERGQRKSTSKVAVARMANRRPGDDARSRRARIDGPGRGPVDGIVQGRGKSFQL